MISNYLGSPILQYQYMNVGLSLLCIIMFLHAARFDVQQLSGYAVLCALINFTIGVVLNEVTLKAVPEMTSTVTMPPDVYMALIYSQIALGIISGLLLFYAYTLQRS